MWNIMYIYRILNFSSKKKNEVGLGLIWSVYLQLIYFFESIYFFNHDASP